MRTESEKHYLLKAIDSFRKRLIVVSPEFEILAASFETVENGKLPIVGKHCHAVFYERESPCVNCAVREVLETGQPSLRPQEDISPDLVKLPCYYAYPVFDGDRIEAVVSMDFIFPNRSVVEDKIRRANALLHNLLLSAPDGVIAADMEGQILIFNEAAEAVFGYTTTEALEELTVHDIYPDGKEYEVMRQLRGTAIGGKGKLNSYRIDVVDKAKNRIPISL